MKFKSKRVDQIKPVTMKFYFDETDQSSGVELRWVTMEDQMAAYKTLVKEEVEYAVHPSTKRLTKVVTPDVDHRDMERWIVDNRIMSFWGIFLDDKELDVTTENKLMLYTGREVDSDGKLIRIIDEENVFSAFVDEKYKELEKHAKKAFGGNSRIKN